MGAIIGTIAKAIIPEVAASVEGAGIAEAAVNEGSDTNPNFKIVEGINTPGYFTNLINLDNYRKGIDKWGDRLRDDIPGEYIRNTVGMSPSVPFTVNILTDNQSIEITINKSPFAETLDKTAVRNAVLNCVKNTMKGYMRSVMVRGNDFPREVR